MKRPTALVVGAGVGGLTAAMRLQHQGFDVELFEKQAGPGGRCGEVRCGPYRFDLGPTILLMPHVLEETFRSVGRELADYLKLHRCDPHYRVHFRDGTRFVLGPESQALRDELERIEPGSYARYQRFIAAGGEKHDVAFARFITRHFDSLKGFITPDLLRVGAFGSLAGQMAGYFESPQLRQALSFQTMYLGLSPKQAPPVFSLLPYTEARHGVWFPEGGLHAVPLALEKVAREEGVQLHYSSPIRRVVVEEGRAVGVELEDGSVRRADVVVCNADYAWASTRLLPEAVAARRAEKLKDARFTSSGLMFYFGLSKRFEKLLHHNVFFGEDFEGSFADIFERGRVPKDPSFYVNAPTRTDASFAPEGHDALYVLVPAPTRDAGLDWQAEAVRVRAQVLARLESEGYGDLAPHVVTERVITPDDWQSALNLERGANFGLSQSLMQLGPFRPKVRDDDVKGLYWCGASIQPGTGVPTVMLSAGFAVDAVLSDAGVRRTAAALSAPSPRPSPARGEGARQVALGYASARAVTRHHAKSFYFASVALFGARRRAAFALYAYCRRLDDLVDEGGQQNLPARLAAARAVTSSVFRGALDLAAVRDAAAFEPDELYALADTVQRFGVPEAPMQDLISGMEMDLEPRRYASWEELDLYCYRVAGTVGMLMTPVLGGTDPAAGPQASALGRAMQLTNILRDVREDLERGRCYLPQDELHRFGLDEQALRSGQVDERFTAFMRFQCERARGLYREGFDGLRYLSGFGARPMVRIMAAVYGGILQVIEARGYDVFSSRAHVPFGAKVNLAAKALLA